MSHLVYCISGSCWTFGTTEAIESALFIETGNLITLSEQGFVSCTLNPDHCGGVGTFKICKFLVFIISRRDKHSYQHPLAGHLLRKVAALVVRQIWYTIMRSRTAFTQRRTTRILQDPVQPLGSASHQKRAL